MNRDYIYCINQHCPFKDCDRHIANISIKEGEFNLADFDAVCERYIRFLVNERCKL